MQYTSLLIASLGFFLIHFVSATNLREMVIKKWGQNVWMMLFSILSLGFFVWMVVEYMGGGRVEDLWAVPRWWLWVNAVLMFVGLGFIVLGNIPDKDARLGKGIFAITRHPTNWGMALFAFAHMVSNPNVEAQLFWGSILGTGVIGSYLLDRRKLKTGGERWVDAPQHSSWVPFWAMIKGRTTLGAEDFKLLPVAVAVAVFFVAMIIHVAFFGTYILPL
ncbi:MAG: hypothetical protein COB24_04445 [Hyphomicrobiales bacterium]|nr:MAG: hypothetical protein COB24_04445 [Hyphomicrobiales bacterium]